MVYLDYNNDLMHSTAAISIDSCAIIFFYISLILVMPCIFSMFRYLLLPIIVLKNLDLIVKH